MAELSAAVAVRPNRERIVQMLRTANSPSDRAFDRWLSDEQQRVSNTYWTPLSVTVRVSQWLHRHGVRSVVDIGSGAGKFCVATALTSECAFTGIEQRQYLVQAARRLAEQFDVDDRVRFIEGTFGIDPMPEGEAYYLFNPFRENLELPERRLDDHLALDRVRYDHEVGRMTSFLEGLHVGTLVIVYGGFGGRMPKCYEVVEVDRELPCMLRCWRKQCSAV